METCTVETGLLRKKPCGEASATRCDNCEQPLCAKHAIAQLTSSGRKSGKHLCKDCDAARLEYEKRAGPEVPAAKPTGNPAAAPAAAKDAQAPVAPASQPAEPARPAPAASKPKPKDEDSLGAIDFTPTKK